RLRTAHGCRASRVASKAAGAVIASVIGRMVDRHAGINGRESEYRVNVDWQDAAECVPESVHAELTPKMDKRADRFARCFCPWHRRKPRGTEANEVDTHDCHDGDTDELDGSGVRVLVHGFPCHFLRANQTGRP